MAAFLASDGMAGNDGLIDFRDCVTLLPEDRYQRIVGNHDELADDPVSSGFDEYHLVTRVCDVFDRALLDGQDGEGFLHYLVLGDEPPARPHDDRLSDEDAKAKFPRLHARYGHLLRPRTTGHVVKGVTLDDLLG
ncbi:hypothetical protein OKA04_12020 [Luteolibacter flavescens]|uniref:Calcineurin-like phosphoesterase domain-containing protein n=1 Tax=Luteolibacter flavescens TaxID=1859460 RepID=A0ABT3FPG1_9BACT|nr:hypothetical protein [Luteolibacter flavescens]MCW1885458.1 hypothetical protein [Luteolibacter flavescens]